MNATTRHTVFAAVSILFLDFQYKLFVLMAAFIWFMCAAFGGSMLGQEKVVDSSRHFECLSVIPVTPEAKDEFGNVRYECKYKEKTLAF